MFNKRLMTGLVQITDALKLRITSSLNLKVKLEYKLDRYTNTVEYCYSDQQVQEKRNCLTITIWYWYKSRHNGGK